MNIKYKCCNEKLLSTFLTFTLVAASILNYAGGQNIAATIDSLTKKLNAAAEDTIKVRLLIDASDLFNRTDTAKAHAYAEQALNLATKLDYTDGMASAHYCIADLLYVGGHSEKALEHYEPALKLFHVQKDQKRIALISRRLGSIYLERGEYKTAEEYIIVSSENAAAIGDSQLLALSYTTHGNIYQRQADFNKSLEYYLKAVHIEEEINDINNLTGNLINIGSIYLMEENSELSLKYYLEALELAEESNFKAAISFLNNNIGIVYMNTEKYDTAYMHFMKSLKMKEELNDRAGIARTCNNIGETLIHQNKLAKALEYQKKALQIQEEIDDKYGIVYSLNDIALIHNRSQDYRASIATAEKSIELAKEIGSKGLLRAIYELQAKNYESLSDYKTAYSYFHLYSEVKDTIINEESRKQIAEMQTKYETEKKEKEIELLNKEKQLQAVEIEKRDAEVKKKNIQRNAFIGGFVMVALLAVVTFMGFRQKKKSNRTLSEKNILITQQKDEIAQTLEELRTTQEHLIESEKMASLGNLVMGVAHEINTPVGIGITASSALVEDTKQFAELYKSEKMSRKELEKYIDNIYLTGALILKNMNRTGELIQNFKQV
ncbi:MAG: tetratricopeptide repeat protein, partial [Bacteroidetes bacterium]|nr:tetratricopeptide repeat protein [Bacteroidota bacterium]